MQERLEIPVLSPHAPPVVLRRGSLPPPFHLAGALARYPHLTPSQRFSAALAARALGALDPRDAALDTRTLGAWLGEHGQDAHALAVLWDLIALPTLNVPAEQASLALGAFVFRTGLLGGVDAGDIGFHVGTLAETIGEPAEVALADAGVEFRLGWRAESLRRAGAGFELQGGEEGFAADAVIVALPHARAAALIEPLLAQLASSIRALGSSPIVNLHIVYDRVVCEAPFAAGVDTPVQYLFDRSAAAGAPAGSQYLAVSLSGRRRADADERRRAARALPARACRAAAGRARRAGAALPRHARARRDLPRRARQRCAASRRCAPRSPGSCSPAAGPTPAGRPRWRAP